MRAPLVCALFLLLSCDGKSQTIDPDKPAGLVLEAEGSPSAARGAAEPRPLGVDSDLFVQDRLILRDGDSLRFQLFHNAAIATWSGPREVALAKSSVWELAGKPIDRMAAGATVRTASAGVHTEREAAETEATEVAPDIGASIPGAPEVDPGEADFDGESAGGLGLRGGGASETGSGRSGSKSDKKRRGDSKTESHLHPPPEDLAKKSSGGGSSANSLEDPLDDGAAKRIDRSELTAWLKRAQVCKSEVADGKTVKIRVEASVDASGKVTSLKLGGDLSPALKRCVQTRLKAAAAPPGEHTLTYPIAN